MVRSDGTLTREFVSCISLVPFIAQLSRERRIKSADWRGVEGLLTSAPIAPTLSQGGGSRVPQLPRWTFLLERAQRIM